ncbi:hypothetical protein LPC13_02860 [Clostridium celatum]|uniref:hypothetical protein n=1 Tax=Clostridium celatum TaxID=36834 RepID=UPI001F26B928|nr:hypothetical protein [Clostridium celatum]MCE9654214.1 hypothetical protein [Clostridium celatum]
MEILDYKLDLIEYRLKGFNKCLGYINTRPLPDRVIEHLFKKMCEKQPWEVSYVDSWGMPEYDYSPKKFFIHFVSIDKTVQKLDIFYDIIELDTLASVYYGQETLRFYVKHENGDLFKSFEYTRYSKETKLDYVLNYSGELIGAIIEVIPQKEKSTLRSSSYSDYDIYSTDDFMRDNGYNPDNDTIEDMYNLD